MSGFNQYFQGRYNALRYSLKGLKSTYKHEIAFRTEIILLLALTPVSVWLASNPLEWALLFGSMLFSLVVELLNSAIEATVDRIGTEHHSLSGRAKDAASAAVFLSLFIVAVIWGSVIYSRFF